MIGSLGVSTRPLLSLRQRWLTHPGPRLSRCAADHTYLYGGFHSQQLRFFEYVINPRAMSRQDKKKDRKGESNKPSYRFVDRTRVRVMGGIGGKGSLSMHSIRRKFKLKADGGYGGNGGSVIIVADPDEQTLSWSHPHAQAEKGTNGTSQDCHGRTGQNLILRVPCGVVVRRVLDYNEVWDEESQMVFKVKADGSLEDYAEVDLEGDMQEGDMQDGHDFQDDEEDINHQQGERETITLADLDEPGSFVMVARGGKGGVGTSVYASRHGALPDARILIDNAKPEPGEVAFLELELKLIADVGLVGFPNAGKSSLLRAMSRATPEVAPYPFTTLHPMLGTIDYRDGFSVRVADIPGLIKGASEGRGKGHDFLRHVERTKALIYIVDVAGVDYRDPVEDLHVLAEEIASYGDGSMLKRRALVIANKIDLIKEDRLAETLLSISEAAKDLGIQTDHDVLGISAGVTGDGIGVLSKAIRDVVTRTEEDRSFAFQGGTKEAFQGGTKEGWEQLVDN
jgi:GTP-binding protein